MELLLGLAILLYIWIRGLLEESGILGEIKRRIKHAEEVAKEKKE